jgi:hypothetical protein
MLRKVIVILGATTAVLAVVGVIFMNAAMREPAMTSCPTLLLPTMKSYASVTVETRYLPWKFTCVYHQGSHVVAKRPSPYSPPWPWK